MKIRKAARGNERHSVLHANLTESRTNEGFKPSSYFYRYLRYVGAEAHVTGSEDPLAATAHHEAAEQAAHAGSLHHCSGCGNQRQAKAAREIKEEE